jgi:hypothetical protein
MNPAPATSAPAAGADAPLYVPAGWQPDRSRDVALDVLRGLAMVILVVNHLRLGAFGHVTGAVLSAAEVLVAVSGVVVGMVFGRRWLTHGGRAVTLMLLRRSRKLYVASVVVVALAGLATLVPWLAGDALAVVQREGVGRVDLYAFDGPLRTALAILTLEAGPWQFSILGFFIASIAIAPLGLWALSRGWWPAVLAVSWAAWAAGRGLHLDVLPSQSERPFPILVWQLLFVNGMVLGWHRHRIANALRDRRTLVGTAIGGLAAAAVTLQLAGPALLEPDAWAAWKSAYFEKRSLDILRIVAMMSIAAALYLVFRRHAARVERWLGPVLLPLGRNSFYVFIVHVFVCLAVATGVRMAPGDGLGPVGDAAVQVACVALLWQMTRRRVLFRWIPR